MDSGQAVSHTVDALPVTALDETFESAFTAMYAIAYRVAYRMVGSRDEANDIAQETLARAAERWSRIAGHHEPWVATVAANLATGYWRTRKRREATRMPSSPHRRDDLASERLDLVRALRHLPKKQRQVVVLRYLADRSEADVAAQLGCAQGTVKSQASRGLAALRTALGSQIGEQ